MRRFLYLSAILFLVIIHQNQAQINSTAAAHPFGSNTSYGYGIMPTNLPTGGSYGQSNDAANAYNTWKSNFVQDCGGGKSRVLYDDNTSTVSEGIGYGMLLAAYAADKTLFDALWAYYKANQASGHVVMNWKIGGCTGASGTGGATDADLDAAWALIIAENQWPTATSPYDYATEATSLITDIKGNEIDPTSYQTINGNQWGFGSTCRNPSYFSPAYYREFAKFITAQAAFWNSATSTSYTFLNTNANSTNGLVSNWADNNGNPGTCAGPLDYGYDACRSPWRMAVDVLWNGPTTAATSSSICTKVAGFTNGYATSMAAPVSLNATAPNGSYHNALFTATWSCGVMGSNSSYQSHMNSCYTETKNVEPAAVYFGATLRVISLFVMTGNFWKPGAVTNCPQPALGADVSICLGANFPIALNSSTATATNVTFTWKKILPTTSTLVSASATANTYSVTSTNGAGRYVVIRDSSGCSKSDTIDILNSITKPSLGTDKNLCSPSSLTLTPSNTASFDAGSTWQWSFNNGSGFTDIAGATATTLSSVRTAGSYRVIATTGTCTNADTIAITSSLATPVDGCTPTTGTVGLSLTNTSAGPYTWFSVPTNGSSLGTGTSYTTSSISTTTTYYVQDNSFSATPYYFGRTAPTAGSTWGISGVSYGDNDKKLKLTVSQTLTIDSITVFREAAAGTSDGITFRILQSDNSTLVNSVTVTGLAIGANRVKIGISLTAGTYIIDGVGSTAQLQMDNAGVTGYPFVSSGVAQINAYVAYVESNGWYPLFYKWKVLVGTSCDRLPIIAKVGGCTGCTLPNSLTLAGSTVCAGVNGTVTVSTSEIGVNYQAYIGTTAVGTLVAGTGANINLTIPSASLTAGANTIIVKGTNSCGTKIFTTTATITVNPLPANVTLTGSSVCIGSNGTVSLAASASGISYQAYISTTAVGTAVAGTGTAIALTVPSASLATGSNTIIVKATNTCGTTTNSTTATINEAAIPSTANAGTDQSIFSSNATLAANTPTIGTGTWGIVTGSATINSTSNPSTTISLIPAGTSVTLRWTISNGACTSSTDDVTITNNSTTTTGINNGLDTKAISLWPNPSKSDFNIDLSSIQSLNSVKILNALGVVVWEEKYYSPQSIINIKTTLSKGMYHVIISGGDNNFPAKLIIEE